MNVYCNLCRCGSKTPRNHNLSS